MLIIYSLIVSKMYWCGQSHVLFSFYYYINIHLQIMYFLKICLMKILDFFLGGAKEKLLAIYE